MAAVLEGLAQFRQAQSSADIIVKLLLSIDRRNDTAAAMDTVRCFVLLASQPEHAHI
jgi:hypothetical protein